MNREPHGYNVIPAVLTGLAVTMAAGSVAAAGFGLSWRFLLLSLLIYSVVTGVVVIAEGNQHPFPRFGSANTVTMGRAVLTALLGGTMAEPRAELLWWSIGILLVVAFSDGLDGSLARRSGMTSGFGGRFDMETDAALIFVLSVLVWQHEKAGVWVLGCGVMRYAFVVGGWLLPWLARPLTPTLRGKTVAVLQYVGLGIALGPVTPVWISEPVAAVTLAVLTWSFAVDVMRLSRGAAVVVHHAS